MASNNQLASTLELAEALQRIDEQILALTATQKMMRAELLERMQTNHEKVSGNYTIVPRTTLVITDTPKAIEWVKEYYPHLMKPDTTALMKVLRQRLEALPSGFALETSEHLKRKGALTNEE